MMCFQVPLFNLPTYGRPIPPKLRYHFDITTSQDFSISRVEAEESPHHTPATCEK